MESLEILQFIWFLIIGFLFAGYTVLDGFDLGAAIALPFLGGGRTETEKVLTSIGPVWDGNEVWLITAGAALFAAFPQAYATVFSGFYLALMLLLFALIFRAVSIEFWFLDENRRGLWKWAFIIGSLLPSLLLGVALGNIIVGIPLDYNMNFAGTFFTLLRPYPLAVGLLGLTAITLQGCSYLILKTEGALQDRARSVAASVWIFHMIILAASIAAAAVFIPGSMTSIGSWACLAVVTASLAAYRITLNSHREWRSFLLSSVSIIGLWGIAGFQLHPNIVKASEGFDMTIASSSSTEGTLRAMLIIAAIGMPVVIGYTIYVYRIFKGKVTVNS